MKTVTLLIVLTALTLASNCSAQTSSSLRRCTGRSSRRSCPAIPAHCHPDDVIDEVVVRLIWRRRPIQCLTGCKVCVSDLPNCVLRPCPTPSCTGGRLTNQVLFIRGRQCKGCLICKNKATCPERQCAPAPREQNCQNLQIIGATTLPDGTKCEGCPFCDPKDVVCGAAPCLPAAPPCDQDPIIFRDFFGKMCPVCPGACQRPLCPLCAACVPPPGYVPPPPDRDGCVLCPPCGTGELIE